MDRRFGGEGGLRLARRPVGEWLLRELQRHAPRRTIERRNLLRAERSQDRHRGLAARSHVLVVMSVCGSG